MSDTEIGFIFDENQSLDNRLSGDVKFPRILKLDQNSV